VQTPLAVTPGITVSSCTRLNGPTALRVALYNDTRFALVYNVLILVLLSQKL
jgi:hypothetical protein